MHPTSKILCEAYKALCKAEGITFTLQERQKEALDSIVKTVNAGYFGIEMYPTQEDRAAAYFCHIIKRHAVTDGNKRLAVLWTDIYSNALNLPLNPKVPFDELAVAVVALKICR
jgi:prophage maintenance system killer protein